MSAKRNDSTRQSPHSRRIRVNPPVHHPPITASPSPRSARTPSVMMHTSLRQHRVVLNLALTQRRAVIRDQHELALTLAQGLEALLVPERVPTAAHDDLQTRVDALGRLLASLLGSHGERLERPAFLSATGAPRGSEADPSARRRGRTRFHRSGQQGVRHESRPIASASHARDLVITRSRRARMRIWVYMHGSGLVTESRGDRPRVVEP